MKHRYITSEIFQEIRTLQHTFQVVRLVDPIRRIAYRIKDADSPLEPSAYSCRADSENRPYCKTCISAKAVADRTFYSKFKMIGSQMFYVCAKYVQIDGLDLALEMMSEVTSNMMLGADSDNEFLQTINELNHTLYRDELTNVYNRRYFNEKFPALLQSTKEPTIVAVAIIDIDNFKEINDTYGHLKGDNVIQSLAGVINSCISSHKGDFLVRFGGDEFIIIYKNITSEAFEQRLQELINKTRSLMYAPNQTTSLTVSIGGAFSSELEVISPQSLFDLADKRLYLAKESGKNQAVLKGGNMNSFESILEKNTIRRIDSRGRIMIPQEILQRLDIENGHQVEVTLCGNKIILTKRCETCILCGGDRDLALYNGKVLCGSCRKKLSGEPESSDFESNSDYQASTRPLIIST